jgi:Protein of unknown function (DUF3168)
MQGASISALEPIATAIYGALNGAGAFTALSPILNDVPQGQAAPYTVLENFTEAPWNTMREYGKTVTFQLHTITKDDVERGDRAGFRIQSAARTVLDYQKFTTTSHQMVQCKFESGDHWKEEAIGGVVTRHHVSIYRVDVWQST